MGPKSGRASASTNRGTTTTTTWDSATAAAVSVVASNRPDERAICRPSSNPVSPGKGVALVDQIHGGLINIGAADPMPGLGKLHCEGEPDLAERNNTDVHGVPFVPHEIGSLSTAWT